MIKIRQVYIRNFRSIKELTWRPSPGINCLIGPGDSGKSSLLDAIELCLGIGSKKASSMNDADFHLLNPKNNICIALTIGGLDDGLMDLEDYGLFARGFDLATGTLYDEPAFGHEPALTLNVNVDEYREPVWSLYSDRAWKKGLTRQLSRKDREKLFSARLNASNTERNLTWSMGSVLTRLTDEALNVNASLMDAARLAKTSFGDVADEQVGKTLAVVDRAAQALGVPTGGKVRALLDTQFLSLREAAVTLHSSEGVPLRCLGTGSTRLLVAGLLKEVSHAAPVVLVDEIEFGLEPHRLTRLLNALGSKLPDSLSQVFLTTHSPVTLQQLRSDHLQVVRRDLGIHVVRSAGTGDPIQGLLRKSPSAFLAEKVVVCEGASEMGLLRGIDDFYVELGESSFLAHGVSLCDAGGGSPRSCIEKAILFANLGYKVAAFIDNDVPIKGDCLERFKALGGELFTWAAGMALEDALFANVSDENVTVLLDLADDFVGRDSINAKLKDGPGGLLTFEFVRHASAEMGYPPPLRANLARASRTTKLDKNGEPDKKKGWFKSIERMECVGRVVIGPELNSHNAGLIPVLHALGNWMTA